MIKVRQYGEIEFLKWIEKNELSGPFEQLAESYLFTNSKNWTLKLFIKLYEDFLCRRLDKDSNINYIQTFDEFCSSVESLKYIQIQTLNKTPYLQPLLKNFISYLRNQNTYKILNANIINVARMVHMQENGFLNWFHIVINNQVEEIKYYFKLYINNSLNISYQYQFKQWLIEKPDKIGKEYTSMEDFLRSNRRQRLIETEYNANFQETIKKVSCTIKLPVQEVEFVDFDFIKYLDDKGLRIEKAIPKNVLDELIDWYCKENIDVKKKELKKFVKNIVNDKSFFKTIINKCKKSLVLDFDINRYYQCKNHGILLFRSADRYSEFLDTYLPDLHSFTRDILDIYFSEDDLKHNISAYDRIEKLCYFKVDRGEIPCFLLWSHKFTEIKVISLEDLSHEEIYKVIKNLVVSLENNTFEKSIQNAKAKAIEIKDQRRPVVYYDLKYSQIAAVGDGAVAVNSTFN